MGGPPMMQQFPGFDAGGVSAHPTGQRAQDAAAVRPRQSYVPPVLTPIKPVTARGQDKEPRKEFRIPTPEELGVGFKVAPIDEPVDWSVVRKRLTDAGATRFGLDKTKEGYRFAFETAKGVATGSGASEGSAVEAAFRNFK